MKSTKNICIVGCGKIGQKHSSRLSKFSSLFFHSRTKASADEFNRKFRGKGVFEQFDEVVDSSDIDAVVIASPPEYHKDQIIRSLQAGKSVLVEKPMCIAVTELAEIERCIGGRCSSSFLMIAENYYYKPSLILIRRLLDAQYIGNIHTVRVKKLFAQPLSGWKRKYGALLEGGIHYIALISAIFNDTPETIEASFPGVLHGRAERSSVTTLGYKNNASAQLAYSWDATSLTRGVFQHSYIIGERGIILFESNGLYLLIRSAGKTGLYLPGFTDLMGYQLMMKDFITCLNDEQRMPCSDFHKAKRDLSIVFKAYEQLSA